MRFTLDADLDDLDDEPRRPECVWPPSAACSIYESCTLGCAQRWYPDCVVVTRQRTRYADTVTPWVPVEEADQP